MAIANGDAGGMMMFQFRYLFGVSVCSSDTNVVYQDVYGMEGLRMKHKDMMSYCSYC